VTVTETDGPAASFEQHRGHLRGVAYRMLGSLSEAEDAVQEGWLRLQRSDTTEVENLKGWLTTVVARVCLDMLRARKARREEALETGAPETPEPRARSKDPEEEAVLADSVGLALLVVLDTLPPAERLAFVLHDLFAVPFEEIAPIVRRSEAATRQLASRARRRVRGKPSVSAADLAGQRQIVDAFLSALRAGDIQGLLNVLDPDLVVRADQAAQTGGGAAEVRGAETWARGAVAFSRGSRFAQPALINGVVGLVVAPRGRLFRTLTFTIVGGRIAGINVIGEPGTLRGLELGAIDQVRRTQRGRRYRILKTE
jgi:RNA polymerase sigma-70 factor (ECF subfamily)